MGVTRRQFIRTVSVTSLGMAFTPAIARGFKSLGPGDTSEIINLSVHQLSGLIHKKQISSFEVVSAFIKRIEQVNPSINAVVLFRPEEALKAARMADAKFYKGKSNGPLHGIPFTIKDSFDTAGIISTAGTLGRRNFIPEKDATVVNRLKNSGAIILGKTNTSEFTMDYFTDNLIFGKTKNPYDFKRSPGGSSGGAAALIAMGGSPFDIGTDTGGSIRFPAHCCGVAGIKPTSGRVPRTGHIISYEGISQSLTHVGPIAKNVADLNLLLRIISGPDNIDPYVYPVQLNDYKKAGIRNFRFAFYSDNGLYRASDATIQTIKNAVKIVSAAGLSIREEIPAGVEEAAKIFGAYLNNNFDWLNKMLKQHGTTKTSLTWIKDKPGISSIEYNKVVERVDTLRSSMMGFWKNYDVLICPVSPMPAILHDEELQREAEYFSYATVFNITGWPSVVIRGGTSEEGLPIGIQIVAPPWREEFCLSVAKFLEDELGPWKTLKM